MYADFIRAAIGGVFIGTAASLMLLFNGRVTGVSGIVSGLLKPTKGEVFWRIFFLAGIVAGGGLLAYFSPDAIGISPKPHLLIPAGLLVGFGTLLGSGCTSGHGVCGISRFSPRSLVATSTFIIFGILSVHLTKRVLGL